MRKLLFLTIVVLLVALVACATTPASTVAPGTVVAGAVATPSSAPETPAVLMTPVGLATETAEPAPVMAPTPELTTTTALPASLELSSYAGRPGQSISLRGEGFAPGEAVHVELRGSPATPLADLAADATGAVSVEGVRVPTLPEGQLALVARGASGREVSRVFSVVGFHPWVVLSSYAIHPGEAFGFSGAEFAPGEEVRVFLDGAEQAIATVQADAQGGLQQELLLRVKPADVGKHNLRFASSSSGADLPVAFEVLAFVPIMELSSYAGPPGSTITFTGRGFAPDETVHVYRQMDEGRHELASFQSDADGSFREAGSVAIAPDDSDKVVTLVLEGDDSKVPVSQRFGLLDLAPWAGLSQYSGPAGTQIDLLGKGFAAGESVELFVGADPVATAQADSQGQFQIGPVAIPSGAQGTITFTFRGASSKGEATAAFTVTGS